MIRDLLHIDTRRVLTTRETVITVSLAATLVAGFVLFGVLILVFVGVEQMRAWLVPLLVIEVCVAAPAVVALVDGTVRSRYGRPTGKHGYVEGKQ